MVVKTEEVMALRRSGHSYREIAETVGVSWQRVQQIVQTQPPTPSLKVEAQGYGQVSVTGDMSGDELTERVVKALRKLGT